MADHNPNPTVHVHHAEIPEEHPERHEHSDVSVRGIWITVGAVFIVTILVHILLYVVFFAYEGAQAKLDESERRSVFPDQRAEPPAGVPRLFASLLAEIDIGPPGEPVLFVPRALAVTKQYQP